MEAHSLIFYRNFCKLKENGMKMLQILRDEIPKAEKELFRWRMQRNDRVHKNTGVCSYPICLIIRVFTNLLTLYSWPSCVPIFFLLLTLMINPQKKPFFSLENWPRRQCAAYVHSGLLTFGSYLWDLCPWIFHSFDQKSSSLLMMSNWKIGNSVPNGRCQNS